MTLTIHVATAADFQQKQADFPSANFLQTAQMGQVHLKTGRFFAQDHLLIKDGDQLIGQARVLYRKRYKFFTEAILLHGPLLDFNQTEQALAAIVALETYLKTKKVARMSFYPYATDSIKDDQLQILSSDLLQPLKAGLSAAGFEASFDPSQSSIVNTMFVKDLTDFENSQAIHENFSPSLKRDLKKFSALHVKVKELSLDEIDQFHKILTETGQRKGFSVQPLSYFTDIKTAFGDEAKFMLAYLDCKGYQDYLTENIQSFEAKIKALEEGPQKKRTKGQIADAADQLRSYYKRQSDFEAMGITSETLPLSSYLFMCSGPEVVSFSGGNYEEYMNFGGATLLHWEMIQWAKAQGAKTLNFYGTIETEAAGKGQGNFNFKRQFGGQLHIMPGEFSKTFHPIFKWIGKLKP